MSSNIERLSLAYLAVWLTAPILATQNVYRFGAVIAVTIWLVQQLRSNENIFLRPTPLAIASLVFIGYTLTAELVLQTPEGFDQNLQLWILLIILIIYESKKRDLYSLTPAFVTLLATLPIWQLTTIATIFAGDVHAARTVVRSSEEAVELLERGVGGYGTVYMTVILLPSLVALNRFLKRIPSTRILGISSIVLRAVVWLNLISSILLICVASYSIALMTLACALLLMLVLNRPSLYKTATAAIVGLLLVTAGDKTISIALAVAEPFAEGTNFARKIGDLAQSLESDSAEGTLLDRLDRYERSFRAAVGSPLTGTLNYDATGKHSEFLDAIARYGLIIGILLPIATLTIPYQVARSSPENFALGWTTFFCTVVVFSLNRSSMLNSAVFAIILPITATLGIYSNPRSEAHLQRP